MAHQVFISYSVKDKPVADAICSGLESSGTRCWIAPRDIIPGATWGEAIVNAISACQAMVLVLSARSNESPQVLREVERAVSKNVTIITFRIEDVVPSAAMEYYISSGHWLDAIAPPVEAHIHKLASILQNQPGYEDKPKEAAPRHTLPRQLTALPRQQTLRAAIDWSYRLLSDLESRLLRRLAIFAGGWDLAGAEGVCAGEGLIEQSIRGIKEANLSALDTQQTFFMELAYAHACLGEIQRAESLVSEFRHLFKAAQYQPRLMNLLGFMAFQKGEPEPSLRYYRESLQHAVQMQWRLDALLALQGYAWALRLAARPAEAARLLGAAAEFRERIGAPVFPRDRPVYDQVIVDLKDSLEEAGFASAWAEGQALGFERACNPD